MTKDVIELAREAGLLLDNSPPAPETHYMARKEKSVQRFAALVAARERERIAKLIADLAGTSDFDKSTCDYLAAAIRALNTEGEGNDRP